jgi:hypothetical protein
MPRRCSAEQSEGRALPRGSSLVYTYISMNSKIVAIEMRSHGSTYSEISSKTGVPKGTLAGWFAGMGWSKSLAISNHARNFSLEKIKKMHDARRAKLEIYYEKAIVEADQVFHASRYDRIFVAGLMIYLGEGDRSVKNNFVRVSNSQSQPIAIFKRFLEHYCPNEATKAKLSLLLYPDLDPQQCKLWWSQNTGLDAESLSKPVIILGRHKTRRLRYGVGTLILSSKFLKKKILRWIDLLGEDLIKADMV